MSSSWSSPSRARRRSHGGEGGEHREAAEDDERHRREAERRHLGAADRRRIARLHEAPAARLQNRDHDQAEPDRGERDAGYVEPRTPLRRRGLRDPLPQQQDPDHDDCLAGEHVAPGELGRHPAADQRSGGNGDRGDPAEQRVCDRAVAALVGRRRQRRDRGHHQHRAEALDAGPADEQHAEIRAQGRGQRADAVDREADRERPVAAEDVAQLRAEQHERRHHQRVERDRGLDPLDRRVEVVDDLRDRDVHDARVEHHHELSRRQDQHWEPASPTACAADGCPVFASPAIPNASLRSRLSQDVATKPPGLRRPAPRAERFCSSAPHWMIRAVDSGTSRQAPGRSETGSETTTRSSRSSAETVVVGCRRAPTRRPRRRTGSRSMLSRIADRV